MASRRPQASDSTPQDSKGLSAADQALKRKLQALVSQARFPQAIRALQQARLRQPTLDVGFNEAQLWLSEGKLAVQQGQYTRAEASLRSALKLGLHGEPHYWLARSRLAQRQPDQALQVMQEAFDTNSLPRDYCGAYFKLLLLTGQTETVRQLITTQPKRFMPHQLHWANGALALLADDPQTALWHFRQVLAPVSPGDHAGLWRAYASHHAGESNALTALLRNSGHPALQTLALALAAEGGQRPSVWLDLDQRDLPQRGVASALELVHHLRLHDFITAADRLLKDERLLGAAVPELGVLRRPLLLLAGEQAREQGAVDNAVRFWRPILDHPSFDPDLAVRLYPLLDTMGADEEAERLASRLLSWLRKTARKQPADWPEPLLSSTLARLHCWLADQLIAQGAFPEARRSVQQAEQLAPSEPDVVGRRGMVVACLERDYGAAIPLLWQALEAGCRSSDVYGVLLECLESTGDAEGIKRLRSGHGKAFDDLEDQGDADVPVWLEALSLPSFSMLRDFLKESSDTSPMVRAMGIFVAYANDGRQGGGKVTLDLPKALPLWMELIDAHEGEELVEILRAIYLIVQRHCRRNRKGITALQNDLYERIVSLAPQWSEAARAQLVLLSFRQPAGDPLRQEASRLLRQAHQPGRLLGLAIMDLRLLASTQPWREMVEAQLRQEPQNPLLLLARATLERQGSSAYQSWLSQGFELARRLQDREALLAFRREEWWRAQSIVSRSVGRGLQALNGGDSLDFMEMLRRIAREAAGKELSPEVLAGLLPSLLDGALELEEEAAHEDDERGGFRPVFVPPPPKPRPTGRRKAWHEL